MFSKIQWDLVVKLCSSLQTAQGNLYMKDGLVWYGLKAQDPQGHIGPVVYEKISYWGEKA